MGMLIDRVRSDAEKIAGYADGLSIYVLILTVFTAPMHPLELLPLIAVTVYLTLRAGRVPLLYAVAVLYIVLSSVSLRIGVAILAAFTLLLSIYVRRFWLALGGLTLSALSYYMLGCSTDIYSYANALAGYMSGGGCEAMGVYLALLPILVVYTAMYTPFFRGTRIGGYIVSNPGSYPVIQFMVLLIYAAVLLALGNESLANRYAEVAYYSLVVGVVLLLKQVASENEGSSGESTG